MDRKKKTNKEKKMNELLEPKVPTPPDLDLGCRPLIKGFRGLFFKARRPLSKGGRGREGVGVRGN